MSNIVDESASDLSAEAAERLRTSTAAVRLSSKWLGTRKTLTTEQRDRCTVTLAEVNVTDRVLEAVRGVLARELRQLDRSLAMVLESDRPWYEERLRVLEDRIRDRLGQLSRRLGDADWLDGAFSAGDLLMVTVLLRLKGSDLLDEWPNLRAYLARGEARPAFKRAFDAQAAVFAAASNG